MKRQQGTHSGNQTNKSSAFWAPAGRKGRAVHPAQSPRADLLQQILADAEGERETLISL